MSEDESKQVIDALDAMNRIVASRGINNTPQDRADLVNIIQLSAGEHLTEDELIVWNYLKGHQ